MASMISVWPWFGCISSWPDADVVACWTYVCHIQSVFIKGNDLSIHRAQKIDIDTLTWCDSISEGGSIMHRQTGLTLFFLLLGLSDSWYTDSHPINNEPNFILENVVLIWLDSLLKWFNRGNQLIMFQEVRLIPTYVLCHSVADRKLIKMQKVNGRGSTGCGIFGSVPPRHHWTCCFSSCFVCSGPICAVLSSKPSVATF